MNMAPVWDRIKDCYSRLQNVLFLIISVFDSIIMVVVLVNTGYDVAMASNKSSGQTEKDVTAAERVFLAFYILECVLKLAALGLQFFKSLWNIIDLSFTVIGVVDVIVEAYHIHISADAQVTSFLKLLKVIRRLKVLRVVRILRVFRVSRHVTFITALLQMSMKSVLFILFLTLCVVLMFSIVFNENFHESDPERFGSLLNTTATVFLQLLVSDDWLDVCYTSRDNGAPSIVVIIIIFIVIVCFTLLNLTFGVLMDNFQLSLERQSLETPKDMQKDDGTDETDKRFYAEMLNAAFPDDQFSKRKKTLTVQYLRLLAAVEQKQQQLHTQISVGRAFTESTYEETDDPWVIQD